MARSASTAWAGSGSASATDSSCLRRMQPAVVVRVPQTNHTSGVLASRSPGEHQSQLLATGFHMPYLELGQLRSLTRTSDRDRGTPTLGSTRLRGPADSRAPAERRGAIALCLAQARFGPASRNPDSMESTSADTLILSVRARLHAASTSLGIKYFPSRMSRV